MARKYYQTTHKRTYWDDNSRKEVLISEDVVDHVVNSPSDNRVLKIIILISMICFFGSFFFTGVIDSTYTNSKEVVTYTDYTGREVSSYMVNYNWTKKINQLSALRPVIDNPVLSIDDNLYKTPMNRVRFFDYYNLGYFNYLGEQTNKTISQYQLLHYSMAQINIYLAEVSGSWELNESVVDMSSPQYNVFYNWWNSEGQFIAKYFYIDNNSNELKVNNNYDENANFNFTNFINVLTSPIRWIINFVYDIGVGFVFLTNW